MGQEWLCPYIPRDFLSQIPKPKKPGPADPEQILSLSSSLVPSASFVVHIGFHKILSKMSKNRKLTFFVFFFSMMKVLDTELFFWLRDSLNRKFVRRNICSPLFLIRVKAGRFKSFLWPAKINIQLMWRHIDIHTYVYRFDAYAKFDLFLCSDTRIIPAESEIKNAVVDRCDRRSFGLPLGSGTFVGRPGVEQPHRLPQDIQGWGDGGTSGGRWTRTAWKSNAKVIF